MLKPYYHRGNDASQPLDLFNTDEYQDGIFRRLKTVYRWADDDDKLKTISEGWVSSMIYDDYDYDYAFKYLKENYWTLGGCSSVQKGNIRGRNYDWNYDNQPTIVIRTPASNGRHATIGVAAGQGELNKDLVNSKQPNSFYRILPFRIVDGVNDAGLIFNTNVCQIYNDAGEIDLTNITDKEDPAIPALMFARYALDFCATVDDVIAIASTRNFFMANCEMLIDELHFMVTDKTGRTVVIEFKDGQPVITEANIMTNYKLCGDTGVDYGAGYERAQILESQYDSITDAESMLDVMKTIWYTNAYKSFIEERDIQWFSECNGKTKLITGETVDLHQGLPAEDYKKVVDGMIWLYNNRSRNTGNTWQTVHTTIYDPDNKRIILVPQENEKYRIELPMEFI